MKKILIIFIASILYLSCYSQSSTLFALYQHPNGTTFGTFNNLTGAYTALSDTICFGSFWSTIDPIHGHLIFKSQEFPGMSISKIHTIDIYTGSVINSISTVDGNFGVRSLEYNPYDSNLYVLYHDTVGTTFGTFDNITGVYTAISGTLCFGSYWSTLDPIHGHLIFKSQEYPAMPDSRVYTVDIHSGNIIASVGYSPDVNSGVRHMEYNPYDSTLYVLYKHSNGTTFGKFDNLTGIYTAISDTLCFGSIISVLDPINGHFIFRSQEFPEAPESNIYTIDIYSGNIIESIPYIDGANTGVIQLEFKNQDGTIEINAGNDNIICNGSIQLNPTIIYNGLYSLTYSWSPSFGLSDTTIINPIANPTSTTTYTITVTDGIETSVDSITIYVDDLPMQEICMVTVDSVYEKNMIVWEKEQLPIESYLIWKETSTAGTYNLLDTVAYYLPSIYVDMTSEPLAQSNKYRISTIDSCGNVSDLSPYHKTIHLNVSPIFPQGYNLTWEHYEGFSFDTYVIYRKHNNNPFDSLTSIAYSPGVFTYSDLNPPVGNIYYTIEAKRIVPCDITQSGSKELEKTYGESISNIVELVNLNVNELSKIYCKIYPNPTTGLILIQTEGIDRVEIMDLQGKQIYTGKEEEINLSQNPKGIYIIKVTTNTGVAIDKIVLE